MASSETDPRPAAIGATLVGRDRELKLIHTLIDGAAVEGRALVIFGEPGVGKTVLLDAAAVAATASGTRVLRAAGVEFEAKLGFSGLNQALLPLSAQVEALPEPHREALSVALGLCTGPTSDRLLVFTAALALLLAAGDEQPVLVIVDDIHWLDRASAAALGFVARRLDGSRVGLIATSRSSSGAFFERSGLPAYELQPLEDQAAQGLIDSRFPALTPRVRQRVLSEAAGNPLALLELPATMEHGTLASAGAQLPPLGPRLQSLFASRVSELPTAARQMLLLLALAGTGECSMLQAASEADGIKDLLPALQADLVAIDDARGRVTFRHPLVRATVVTLATEDERRRAHKVLAEALTDRPERMAWHLGQATIRPDEKVAGLLEDAARQAVQRGDAVGAIATWIRAADLSPTRSERSRRLALAAYTGADVTGELHDVSRLLIDARREDPQIGGSLQAAATTAHVLINGDGDIDTAHRLLVGAIETLAGSYDDHDGSLAEALYTLAAVCFWGGRAELWDPLDKALARMNPRPALLSLLINLFADPARATSEHVAELEGMVARHQDEVDPTMIVRIGRAAFFVDRVTNLREAHRRVVRDGREGGALTCAIYALINLSLNDYLIGEWDEALKLADEGLRLCEAHGYGMLEWPLQFAKAIVAAGRGDHATASMLTATMDRWAAPRNAQTVRMYAAHARALAALADGDHASAYQHLVAISPPGSLPSHNPLAVWAIMDLVIAADRTDRHSDAINHANAVGQSNLPSLSPRLALISAASAAIATPNEDARELFEAALAIPGIDRWPFDLARVRLAYGQHLRRMLAKAEARKQLGAALRGFEELGAKPWAAQASRELEATGMTGLRTGDGAQHGLSPQELVMAQLAAAGLSNREIGERLFLSHRTVGGHLYRAFPKLGITSRAALRDALALDQLAEDDGSIPRRTDHET